MIARESAQKRTDFIMDPKGNKRRVEVGKSRGKQTAGFRFSVSQHKPKQLNTGFHKMTTNPWAEKIDTISSVYKHLEGKEKISYQDYFEVRLGLEPGTLTSVPKPIFDKKVALPWIQKWYRDFKDVTVLDLDDPEDEMTHHLLLHTSPDKCANSFDEITPHSRMYISLVHEDEEKQVRRNEKIEEGIANLVDLKRTYSSDEMYKVAVVLNLAKGSVNDTMVKNSLSTFITEKSKSQIDNIADFNEVYELFTGDVKQKEEFEAKYLLKELINNRIVSDYRGKYTWASKKNTNLELIGRSEAEALNFLLDIDNRGYREELVEELKAKLDDARHMAL